MIGTQEIVIFRQISRNRLQKQVIPQQVNRSLRKYNTAAKEWCRHSRNIKFEGQISRARQ